MSVRDLHEVSDQDFLTELGHRPNLVGGAAAEAAGFDIQYINVADEAFRAQVSRFLDTDERMSLGDQMDVMGQFWERLGYKDMPRPHLGDLSDGQVDMLRGTLKEFPDRRVVPAPFLDVVDRKSIAERARSFERNGFAMDRDALSVPSRWPISTYGRLLMNPDGIIEDPQNKYARRRSDRKYYALRYMTPEGVGGVVGRSHYLAAMEKAGQSVPSSLNTWVFPVMDVRAKERSGYSVDAFTAYHSIDFDPASTPEALIALQLLRQTAGEPVPHLQKDIANEAVYEVSKRGKTGALARVAIVGWYPDASTIRLDATAGDKADENTGIRSIVSGLEF